MHGRSNFSAALFLLTAILPLTAQVKDKDLNAYLAGVTERGRALYAYDQAAWHGTDAFFALHPNTDGLTHYICIKTPTGWEEVFPKWNETHDRLLVAYEALESGGPDHYEARAYNPPREGPDDLIPKERALELALVTFTHPNRPYNAAILPAENGALYVYLYPAQTKETVWPLGGDVRYTISADGKQILETRQLHHDILDLEFDPGKHAVSGYHTHVLSDVPEDTDVFYVLNRRPLVPEYIGAGKRVFVVNTDGSIVRTKK
ncbi:MAG: hypothetical protein ACLQHF_06475 [Terracidiphilus sp.]